MGLTYLNNSYFIIINLCKNLILSDIMVNSIFKYVKWNYNNNNNQNNKEMMCI